MFLGRGHKIKYNLISVTKSISKIFIPIFACAFTNKRYKIYRTSFLFCPLSLVPELRLGGVEALGVPRGSIISFQNMAMWHIKLKGMMNRTECNYDFHPRVKLVTLGEVKRSNIIKFQLQNQFQRCSQIKYIKYLTKFSFCRLGHAPGVGQWGAGGQNLQRGDWRLHSIDWAC